jgi:cobalt/nickel transport system ATP-binding protein
MSAEQRTEIVKVSCAKHTYPDKTQVDLCGLEFTVAAGERVIILGANGSGKTTLIHHLLGLLKPTEGVVTVFGVEPWRSFKEIRARLGVVLQNVDEQLIAPTVWEDVSFMPRNMGVERKKVEEMTRSALERLEISHLADKVPHFLSGGEKRRVALAGALVMNPELLILDEPFADLDPHSRRELVNILNTLNRERGVALVVSTHDVDTVPFIADTVYVLARGGAVIQRGKPADILSKVDLLHSVNVDPPILTELFMRLKLGDAGALPASVEEAERVLKRMLET